MLRSVVAVIAGFAAMAIVVVVSTALAAESMIEGGMRSMADPTFRPPRGYLLVNLAASAFAAVMGGFVTGWLATGEAVAHAIWLAGVMVVMALFSSRQYRDRQPRWYQLVLIFVMPLFAIAGGWMASGWGAPP